MATKKQKAAARRNIRKAQAANRRRNGCKYGKSKSKNRCRKAYRTARQIAAARRNIKKAHAANRRRGRGGSRRTKRKSGSKKKSRRRGALSGAALSAVQRKNARYYSTRANVLGEMEGPVGPERYV